MMLGNLSLQEMQKRSGVEFPDELLEYMGSRHQEAADKIAPGKWHCFDLPFTLVCGDMETAQSIYNHLVPLTSKFKEQMQIVTS